MKKSSTALELVADLRLSKKRLISEKKIIEKKDNHVYPIINSDFDIPNNWVWIFLSDISIIQEGPGIRKYQYEEEGIQFLTVTNILDGSVDLNKSKKFISLQEYNSKYTHFKINKGDIVTACSGASWGKSAIYNDINEIILNTSTLRLRFFDDLGINKYLYYLTKTQYFKSNLNSHSTGQQANFGYSHYSKIPIPLAPLEKQKQIVEILDTAFEALEKAKTNLEKNLKNTKELFDSKLNEIFSQKGEGWEEKTLGDACILQMGQSPKGITYNTEGIGTPLINGPVEFGKGPFEKTIKSKFTSKPTKLCKENDLILCVRGSTTGKINIAGFDACIGRGVASIRFEENQMWLNFFIRLKQKDIYKLGTGATFPNVSGATLSNMLFPVPPKIKQDELINTMNLMLEHTNYLEQKYQQKLDNLAELKKSLLQKAFSGELTN